MSDIIGGLNRHLRHFVSPSDAPAGHHGGREGAAGEADRGRGEIPGAPARGGGAGPEGGGDERAGAKALPEAKRQAPPGSERRGEFVVEISRELYVRLNCGALIFPPSTARPDDHRNSTCAPRSRTSPTPAPSSPTSASASPTFAACSTSSSTTARP